MDSQGTLIKEGANICNSAEAGVLFLTELLLMEKELKSIASRKLPMLEDSTDPEFITRLKSIENCNHCGQKLHGRKKHETNDRLLLLPGWSITDHPT